MSLESKVNQDIKSAMLAKDQPALRALRAIKAALLLAVTEKGASQTLDEKSEIKILQKLVKQRKDSLAIYREQKREDLARKEEEEIDVINQYLPEQMSDEELKGELQHIIAELNATGMKDMGKVMGVANSKLAGKADGKTIANTVKQLLT